MEQPLFSHFNITVYYGYDVVGRVPNKPKST
jgi:hypothetical protein